MAEKNNKLVRGMVVGALVGAGISLFDRDTRHSTVRNIRQCSQKAWGNVKNPTQMVEKVSDTVVRVNQQIKSVSDDAIFIMDKINELSGSQEKRVGNDSEQVVQFKPKE